MSFRHITLSACQQLRLHTARGLVQLEIARGGGVGSVKTNPYVDLVIQDRDGVRIEIVDVEPYNAAKKDL